MNIKAENYYIRPSGIIVGDKSRAIMALVEKYSPMDKYLKEMLKSFTPIINEEKNKSNFS